MKKTRLLLLAFLVVFISSCEKEVVEPFSSETESIVEEIPFHDQYVAPQNYDFIDAAEELFKASKDNNLTMGNPSGAYASSGRYWDYLINRSQYAVSYHRDRGTPNWVSWHLSTAWLGSNNSTSRFYTASLPSEWYRVKSDDYKYSGYDRGHNCPSADRTRSSSDNKSTYYMTNVTPQEPRLNQRGWKYLEEYCRKLVRSGNELYIICGSYGSKGTLADGKVTIPSRCWKVILVLPDGSNDVSRVTRDTRVIAVDMPNSSSVGTSWGSYRTTVDAIERTRRYNLLSSLPSSIQSAIESKRDTGPTR